MNSITCSQDAGLYIHIPFCVRKCPYCDFYSVAELSLKSRFLKALLREMELVSHEGLRFDTLYIGGGTPSIYEYNHVGQMVAASFQNFDFQPDSEITMEVNPGTVSFEQLKGYREAGINRINIGVQSFQQKSLAFLGRIHTEHEAHRVIKDALRAGFENIGFDLIYGLPDQSKADWLEDMKQAVESDPPHLSCYMLTYEKGTPLHNDLLAGRVRSLADDRMRALFETTIEFLEDHGYFQYETSNFARIGNDGKPHVSKHNLKYWTLAPYIGLGPSAHSFIEPRRYWNVSNVDEYIAAIESGRLPTADGEILSREKQLIEAIYLGLRMTGGIDLVGFKAKYGIDFVKTFKEIISDLEKQNYIGIKNSRCALTQRGRAFADSIASLFVARDLSDADVKS
ncbi:MAG: radical SAM family heme chaperone HemW [Desulfobacterales bacterium]|jgi:oxygen-independent coproporphyrinogen-3 oxidase